MPERPNASFSSPTAHPKEQVVDLRDGRGVRFILVEGNDGTGKTTLVEALRSALAPQGWDTASLAHRPGDQFHRYLHAYATADRMVFNRSHYAERVFGQHYRSGNPFSSREQGVLDTIAFTYGLVIHCDLPVAELAKRLEVRRRGEVLGGEGVDLETLAATAQAFTEVFRDKPVIRYVPRTADDLRGVLVGVERRVLRTSGANGTAKHQADY